MSWLSKILGGDKKVWREIRKAGYRTARGYLASKVALPGLPRIDKLPELDFEELVELLESLDVLRSRLPHPFKDEMGHLLSKFLHGPTN